MLRRRLGWLVLSAAVLSVIGTPARAEDSKLTFEIYPDAKMEYRWRLKAGNGKVIATPGQGYKAKADAKNGVERIMADADKLTFEVYEDKKKEHRWRLKAKNGQVIASSSEGYADKAGAEKSVELVKTGAKGATVVEIKSDK